jgi:hypothetical protein
MPSDDGHAVTARPPRDEYPDPDRSDLAAAVRAVLGDEQGSHHRRGRYTSTWTYTEHDPDMKPGEKTKVVRVTVCEREVLCDIPIDQADELLAVLEDDR